MTAAKTKLNYTFVNEILITDAINGQPKKMHAFIMGRAFAGFPEFCIPRAWSKRAYRERRNSSTLRENRFAKLTRVQYKNQKPSTRTRTVTIVWLFFFFFLGQMDGPYKDNVLYAKIDYTSNLTCVYLFRIYNLHTNLHRTYRHCT